jgi:hypothetical protein
MFRYSLISLAMGILLFLRRTRLLPWHKPLLYKSMFDNLFGGLNSSERTTPELHHFPLMEIALAVVRCDEWVLNLLMEAPVFRNLSDLKCTASPW